MVPGPVPADPVLVALPGTLCAPAVFGPLADALADEVTVDPVSWLTEPGPGDIPSIAERVADHISSRWPAPVLVCGHSTGGAIALQLAVRSCARPCLTGRSWSRSRRRSGRNSWPGPRQSTSRRSTTCWPASVTWPTLSAMF